MTPHVGDSNRTDALTALVDLARTSVQPATPVQLAQGLDQVAARLSERRLRRRLVLRRSFLLATAGACALLVLGAVSVSHKRVHPTVQPALTYQIEGGNVIEGGYLHEAGNSGMKLFFTEGTEFILMPGARGRLRTVDSRGAHIAIEQGAASFQVTPRSDARWLVDVGPFLVTVKGTVFAVSWDASAERFELRLRHGRVSVSGPVTGGEVSLRAGQRLLVDLSKAETIITEQKPEEAWLDSIDPSAADGPTQAGSTPSVPSASIERPTARPSKGATPSALTRPERARPEANRSDVAKANAERRWSESIAAGDWDRILAEVERTGIKPTLEGASSEDLYALADAARYRRRDGLAREALVAERRRFPQSDRALDAAFLLGRLEEDRAQGARKALRWYDEYLTRAPTGTYASEALGRKMIVTNRLEGAATAQPIAEDYLRRFPNGSYAGAARALRRGP